ncbi:MAG: M23 family metallopeptidase [Cyanobacteria bacterium P01_A01_bin.45]|mgnify:CR=1 FL=1
MKKWQNQLLISVLSIFSILVLSTLLTISNISPAKIANAQITNNSKTLLTSNWLSASFPVENFQKYTSPFGYRRSPTGGSVEFHNGLDIAAPKGSYIRNWWTGTVTQLSDRGRCGTRITIQSGKWRHTYCHMEGYVAKKNGRPYLVDSKGGIIIWKGQRVGAGTRIGRVGMTGRTTGPHLHWSLKYGKKYVDPAIVLRRMYSQQASR